MSSALTDQFVYLQKFRRNPVRSDGCGLGHIVLSANGSKE